MKTFRDEICNKELVWKNHDSNYSENKNCIWGSWKKDPEMSAGCGITKKSKLNA
jgi:hypothetical protein